MKCNSCSFIYKKIGGGVPTFNFSNGNPTGAIATTSRNRTKQLRVLAEASNTKVQYKGGIASTNSYISSINCNPNFSIINYRLPTNCSSRIPCDNNPCSEINNIILDGGDETLNNNCLLSGYGTIPYDGGNENSGFCLNP